MIDLEYRMMVRNIQEKEEILEEKEECKGKEMKENKEED